MLWARQSPPTSASGARRPNLSAAARRYVERLNPSVEDLFHHVLATLHDPAYRQANAGALRMEWPRIPLPYWSDLSAPAGQGAVPGRGASRSAPTRESAAPGAEGGSRTSPTATCEPPAAARADQAAATVAASASRGRQLAALLDPDTPVPGVTSGHLRPEIAAIAVPATTHGRHMAGDDFALTSGWGHFGAGQAVMPGQGRAVERAYTGAERTHTRPERTHTGAERTVLSAAASVIPAPAGIQPPTPARAADDGFQVTPGLTAGGAAGGQVEGVTLDALGATTYDIHLNDHAYWRNIPANVWAYRLGGYRVLKKWLSYRERKILGRDLRPAEVQHFSQTARRIGAILLRTAGE